MQLGVPGEVGVLLKVFSTYENVLDFKMVEVNWCRLLQVCIIVSLHSGHMMSNYATFSSKHVCNQNKYGIIMIMDLINVLCGLFKTQTNKI